MSVSTLRGRPFSRPVDDPAAGVIHDARRRQRRRRIAASLVAVVFGALLATCEVLLGPHPGDRSSPRTIPFVASGAVLSGQPYLGVACTDPNTIACDRVGLAVRLRRPGVAVAATIGGRTFVLHPDLPHHIHPVGTPTHDAPIPAVAFTGYLRPAGLRERLGVRPDVDATHWIGRRAVTPLLRLRITQADGTVLDTQLAVRLSAGWG